MLSPCTFRQRWFPPEGLPGRATEAREPLHQAPAEATGAAVRAAPNWSAGASGRRGGRLRCRVVVPGVLPQRRAGPQHGVLPGPRVVADRSSAAVRRSAHRARRRAADASCPPPCRGSVSIQEWWAPGTRYSVASARSAMSCALAKGTTPSFSPCTTMVGNRWRRMAASSGEVPEPMIACSGPEPARSADGPSAPGDRPAGSHEFGGGSRAGSPCASTAAASRWRPPCGRAQARGEDRFVEGRPGGGIEQHGGQHPFRVVGGEVDDHPPAHGVAHEHRLARRAHRGCAGSDRTRSSSAAARQGRGFAVTGGIWGDDQKAQPTQPAQQPQVGAAVEPETVQEHQWDTRSADGHPDRWSPSRVKTRWVRRTRLVGKLGSGARPEGSRSRDRESPRRCGVGTGPAAVR